MKDSGNNMSKRKTGVPTKGTAAWDASQDGKKEGISTKALTGQAQAAGYDGGSYPRKVRSGNKITASTPSY